MDSFLALVTAELGDVPMLDLHGTPTRLVDAQIDEFLQSRWMRGDGAVRIIHGKGEGAVMRETLTVLRNHELVADYRVHETGGSTAVALIEK